MRRFLLGVSVVSLVGVPALLPLAGGCAMDSTDCASDGTCAGSGLDAGADTGVNVTPNPDATPGGDTGAPDGSKPPDPPPGCDPTKDINTQPQCVDTKIAVFVDGASGDDGKDGSKEAPVKTIGQALKKLGTKELIYVCDAGSTHNERITIDRAVSIYGGFSCAKWEYGTTKAKLAPTARGIVIEIKGTTKEIVLADLDVVAANADPTVKGESSIAIFAANASSVVLRRMKVTAGTGADGGLPGAPTEYSGPAPNGTAGDAPPPAVKGAQTINPQCVTSIGGAGGLSGTQGLDGAKGAVAVANVQPSGADGSGGTSASGVCDNKRGSNGPGGGLGSGGQSLGILSAQGWTPSSGGAGGRGTDGQGGGGGARLTGGNVGGSGGAGGCGGAGGIGGQGGGGSIAVASFESVVVLDSSSSLVAQRGGVGGTGGRGQRGQLGGSGGTVPNQGEACPGALGGTGGSGGGGGGGAGGVSVGVLYKGSPPKVDGSELADKDSLSYVLLGAPGGVGPLGPGGDAPAGVATSPGVPGTPGVVGVARAVLAVP